MDLSGKRQSEICNNQRDLKNNILQYFVSIQRCIIHKIIDLLLVLKIYPKIFTHLNSAIFVSIESKSGSNQNRKDD